MSEFLNLLQNLNPYIESSQADELRAVFVALNQQTENVADSATWSLNHWLQWLDDEGFDRTALMGTLNSLVIAASGQQAWDHLSTNLRTHMEDTDGLGLLQEMVEREDQELLARLHTLETVALREHLTLAQTAGGLSKVAKDTLYGVGGLVLIGGGIGLYKLWKNRQREVAEAAQGAKREENKMENVVERDSRELKDGIGKFIASDSKPQGLSDLLGNLPDSAHANTKDILSYTEDDIQIRAGMLAMEHMTTYCGEHFTAWMESTIKKMPAYAKEVEKEASKDPEYFGDIGKGLSDDKRVIAETNIKDGEWYKGTKSYIENKFQTNIRNAFMKDAEPFYEDLVRKEVSVAKAAAENSENKFYKDLAELDENIIQRSEVKIDKDIVAFTDDAKSAVRDFEKQAESDLGIVEEKAVRDLDDSAALT